ncbi:DUF1501 domain-containing protein [Symmachiella dynata]|uniref:DUF1501 domain-containing protein n=1 Tax=Symmachiella dynata TaxID=2527995 RepID=UPI0030EE4730
MQTPVSIQHDCGNVSRRTILQAGLTGLGAATLPDLLRQRAAAGQASRKTAVIFIELAGGPTQFETYDPKPLAPVEYRGPMSTVQTNQPGTYFSETMSQQAKILDKLTIIRSIHHRKNSHDPSSHLSQTGYYKTGPKGGPNQMPSFGSVIHKVRGANTAGLPAYVAIPNTMRNGGSAHLGKGCNAFETVDNPSKKNFKVRNLALAGGMDMRRLDDRRGLLKALDDDRRMLDLEGSSAAIDQFTTQAFDMVSGSAAREAFDISREDDKLRDAYGRSTAGQGMLLARRLVEAGVTCVTVRSTGWDHHGSLPKRIVKNGVEFDRGMAALVNDLYDRGLQQDVLVVAMGEFGRAPRFNKDAGRGHWGAVMSVALAGGGLKTGILGASNSKGEIPAEAPYQPENVLAMLYRHLGIDPAMTFDDFAGRPRYVLERRELIRELV